MLKKVEEKVLQDLRGDVDTQIEASQAEFESKMRVKEEQLTQAEEQIEEQNEQISRLVHLLSQKDQSQSQLLQHNNTLNAHLKAMQVVQLALKHKQASSKLGLVRAFLVWRSQVSDQYILEHLQRDINARAAAESSRYNGLRMHTALKAFFRTKEKMLLARAFSRFRGRCESKK